MVPWWGLLMAFMAGTAFGIVLIALISANDDDKKG